MEFDSADLRARYLLEIKRPTADAGVVESDTYALLTEGLRYIQALLAVHGLEQNAVWEQATNVSGDLVTYAITQEPVGKVSAFDGRNGCMLRLGPDGDPNTDLVWQGTTFLVPGNLTRAYGNGLWVRYTPEHGPIAAGVDPTLLPLRARLGAVYRAAELWFDRGGFRDNAIFGNKIHKLLFGDPTMPGDVGIVTAQKQTFYAGPNVGPWWRTSRDFVR